MVLTCLCPMELNLSLSLDRTAVREFAEQTANALARRLAQTTNSFIDVTISDIDEGARAVLSIENGQEIAMQFSPGGKVIPVIGVTAPSGTAITSDLISKHLAEIAPDILGKFINRMVNVDIR